MSIAYAHSLSEALYEPLPEGLFVYKLDWDPTLLFFLLMAYLYIRGLRAFKGKLPIKKWQVFCFFIGVTINVIALSPPIDPLSDRLFFMHMVQHILITTVGVPIMLFGVPFYVIIRGVSPGFRRRIYFPIVRNKVIRKLNSFFLFPLVALIVYESNYWFWHVPRFYNWALLNDLIHLVEHGCMAITSLYLWRNIIDPYPLRASLHMGFRLIFLGAIMTLDTILAAALTYSDTIWYAYEGIPSPKWWSQRWDHLDDQRLGGLIMWVPGGFLLFIAMTICFFVWVQREQKLDAKRQAERQNAEEKSKQILASPI